MRNLFLFFIIKLIEVSAQIDSMGIASINACEHMGTLKYDCEQTKQLKYLLLIRTLIAANKIASDITLILNNR